MTPRERMMALVAMHVLFVFGGGLLGYQFILRPMKTAETRTITALDEVGKDQNQLDELETALPRLELMKKMSLPADPVFASFAYGAELEKMLRASDFAAGKLDIARKEADRSSTTTTKKPPYQRLLYDVKASGDLASLVAFLDKFYATPLLHRIRTLKIDRPVTTTAQQGKTDLNITLSIEALIVDGAEKRDTLLPAGVTVPKRLARTDEQYASIAGRDIFYGPPPPPVRISTETGEPKVEVELADCIHLDEITIGDKGSVASLYDVLNNRRYMIQIDTDGTINVNQYYYIKDRKKLLDFGKELVITDDQDKTVMKYNAVRIDATRLVLESEDTFFTLHIGGKMSDVKELKPAEAKAMGLPVKEKKDDKKEKDKKDDKKEKDKKDEATGEPAGK